MPRRRNSDAEKIQASINTACPHWGTQIEPNDYKRVDYEHLECPRGAASSSFLASVKPLTAASAPPGSVWKPRALGASAASQRGNLLLVSHLTGAPHLVSFEGETARIFRLLRLGAR